MANQKLDDDLEMIDISSPDTKPQKSGDTDGSDRSKNSSSGSNKNGRSSKTDSTPKSKHEKHEDSASGKKSRGRTYQNEEVENEDYEGEDYEEDDDEPSGKGGNILQIILVSAMLLIIAAVAIMLVRWQKGIDLTITEDDLTEDYDIESEDFYSPFDPYEVEGYEDDGELNIVILGDQTIYNYNDETGIASLISEKADANVTALALPDTKIALTEAGFTLEHAEDAFNLYYLTLSICGGQHGSYDLQESALNYIEDNEAYQEYVTALKSIDFSKVDILILCYGFNDYLVSSRSIGDEIYSEHPYGSMDSLCGSLDSSLQSLNDRFPSMQVIVSSPSYCFVEDEDGEEIGADLYNPENGSLGDYVAFTKSVTQAHQASFVDNYFFSDFNADKYDGYLGDDGMPNAAARELIADHIISFFYFNR